MIDTTKFVSCESTDGWSLHAPGSTDRQIAEGDAPPLVSGPWQDESHTIPEGAYEQAQRALDAIEG